MDARMVDWDRAYFWLERIALLLLLTSLKNPIWFYTVFVQIALINAGYYLNYINRRKTQQPAATPPITTIKKLEEYKKSELLEERNESMECVRESMLDWDKIDSSSDSEWIEANLTTEKNEKTESDEEEMEYEGWIYEEDVKTKIKRLREECAKQREQHGENLLQKEKELESISCYYKQQIEIERKKHQENLLHKENEFEEQIHMEREKHRISLLEQEKELGKEYEEVIEMEGKANQMNLIKMEKELNKVIMDYEEEIKKLKEQHRESIMNKEKLVEMNIKEHREREKKLTQAWDESKYEYNNKMVRLQEKLEGETTIWMELSNEQTHKLQTEIQRSELYKKQMEEYKNEKEQVEEKYNLATERFMKVSKEQNLELGTEIERSEVYKKHMEEYSNKMIQLEGEIKGWIELCNKQMLKLQTEIDKGEFYKSLAEEYIETGNNDEENDEYVGSDEEI